MTQKEGSRKPRGPFHGQKAGEFNEGDMESSQFGTANAKLFIFFVFKTVNLRDCPYPQFSLHKKINLLVLVQCLIRIYPHILPS